MRAGPPREGAYGPGLALPGPWAGSTRLGHLCLCSAASAPVSSATHPGVPSELYRVRLAGYSQVPCFQNTPSHPSLMGAPAFLGTTSWFDMARLLTTLTMASRLTLAPLTWTWPCSIEMLVEVGARAREEGLRGSLPCSPFFCPQVGAAADRAGASSPKVAAPGSTYPDSPNSPGHDPALLFLPPTPSLPRVPRASLKTPTALTSPGHCCVFLLTFPPPGADSDSDSDLSLEEERSLSIPSSESEDNGRTRGRFQRPLRRAAQSERLLTHPKGNRTPLTPWVTKRYPIFHLGVNPGAPLAPEDSWD